MKKKWLFTLACIAGYLVLLELLVWFERDSEGITDLFSAFWYSLVTVTTVGYGDVYPHSVMGRVIGALFVFISLGVMTTLIGLAVNTLTGYVLPVLRIRFSDAKRVYVFDRTDGLALSFAENLLNENADMLCVFSQCTQSLPGNRYVKFQLTTGETVEAVSGMHKEVTVVFTGMDAEERLALCRIPEGIKIVCQSEHRSDLCESGIRFFDRKALTASGYWQRFPMSRSDRKIVLIGFEEIGRSLLEHALGNCVFSPAYVREYHVIGDGRSFLADHYALGASVRIGQTSNREDSLFFHDAAWNEERELLLSADRIILCFDDSGRNAEVFHRLRQYFATHAAVHAYSAGELTGEMITFGSNCEIMTPENVLRTASERLAIALNDIYRNSVGGNAPRWEELSPFLRESNLSVAFHVSAKLRFLLDNDSLTSFTPEMVNEAFSRFLRLREQNPDLCRRIEHDRWMRFHALHNWSYAPVRDNAKRHHPLLVPFDSLSTAEQMKDDYPWEVLEMLTKYFDEKFVL